MRDWLIEADGDKPGAPALPPVDASASIVASSLLLLLMRTSRTDKHGNVIISSTSRHRMALVISAIANRVYTLNDLCEMDLDRFGEVPASHPEINGGET